VIISKFLYIFFYYCSCCCFCCWHDGDWLISTYYSFKLNEIIVADLWCKRLFIYCIGPIWSMISSMRKKNEHAPIPDDPSKNYPGFIKKVDKFQRLCSGFKTRKYLKEIWHRVGVKFKTCQKWVVNRERMSKPGHLFVEITFFVEMFVSDTVVSKRRHGRHKIKNKVVKALLKLNWTGWTGTYK